MAFFDSKNLVVHRLDEMFYELETSPNRQDWEFAKLLRSEIDKLCRESYEKGKDDEGAEYESLRDYDIDELRDLVREKDSLIADLEEEIEEKNGMIKEMENARKEFEEEAGSYEEVKKVLYAMDNFCDKYGSPSDIAKLLDKMSEAQNGVV